MHVPLAIENELEITLLMPSEISFAENLRVRCHSRVMLAESGTSLEKFAFISPA